MTEEVRDSDLVISSITAGPLMTNYFVIGSRATGEAAVVDAGYAGDRIIAMATDEKLEVTKIWQTHAHIDHVAALGEVVEKTGAPIWLHPDDQQLYDAAPMQGRFFGYEIEPLPAVSHHFDESERITIGDYSARVLHLPGHSPGCVAFWFEELGVVFGGDVLFAGSIGRVDLPGSDPQAMKRSLERMVELLPDETRVLPGHGPETTIGMEKKRNPFLLQDW